MNVVFRDIYVHIMEKVVQCQIIVFSIVKLKKHFHFQITTNISEFSFGDRRKKCRYHLFLLVEVKFRE